MNLYGEPINEMVSMSIFVEMQNSFDEQVNSDWDITFIWLTQWLNCEGWDLNGWQFVETILYFLFSLWPKMPNNL